LLYRGPSLVIPNGLPESIFSLRSTKTMEVGKPVFATVLTGWNTLKNGGALLIAFGRVRAAIPGAKLIMMGHGHELGGLAHSWAQARGLSDGVEFVGQIPQAVALQRLATEADVYVHPSLEEACSMALAEACAIGLPCIGGEKSGGVPFSLNGGSAGLLVSLTSVDELAGAMLRLTMDQRERVRIAAAGYEYARSRFRIESVVDEYLDVYARIGRAA
jgi:glycosyltransferase involved in cell wall biosynthesis